jgi:hypothetical protein
MIHLRPCASLFPRVILTIYDSYVVFTSNVGMATVEVCLKPYYDNHLHYESSPNTHALFTGRLLYIIL